MGLAHIQDLLGTLYTDPEIRRRFAAAPESVGHEFGLSAREASQCHLLSPEQVAFFAESLLRKRLGSIRAMLPRTSRALRIDIEQYFKDYRASAGGPPLQNSAAEALAFADYLADRFSSSRIADTVKLDAGELAMRNPSRHIVVESLRAPLEAIANNTDEPTFGRRTLVVWFRLIRGTYARYNWRRLWKAPRTDIRNSLLETRSTPCSSVAAGQYRASPRSTCSPRRGWPCARSR
jgi:hypothetical protein